MVSISASRKGARWASGFSLIELMLAMALGLIVLGIVGVMYTTGLRGNNLAIKRMALYQSLNDAASTMALEVGRAGWHEGGGATVTLSGSATSGHPDSPVSPYGVIRNMTLVSPSGSVVSNASVPSPSACLAYVYERKVSGTIQPQNGAFFLYYTRDGVLSLFWQKNSTPDVGAVSLCTPSRSLPPLTDPDLIRITAFDVQQDTVVRGDEVSRYIRFVLQGELRHDASVTTTITREVKVRNWG